MIKCCHFSSVCGRKGTLAKCKKQILNTFKHRNLKSTAFLAVTFVLLLMFNKIVFYDASGNDYGFQVPCFRCIIKLFYNANAKYYVFLSVLSSSEQ